MRINAVAALLAGLLVGPGILIAQHDAPPRRTMQPFNSDSELVQFLAQLDEARPSRRAPGTCPDGAQSRGTGRTYVIAGRVGTAQGEPIRNVVVAADALGLCTLTAADGSYRLLIPRSE